jgi:hypothetical protein
VPFDRLEPEHQALLLDRLGIESRQLVLERRGAAGRYAAMADTRNGMIVNGDLVNQLLPAVQENPTLGLAMLHEAGLEVLMDLFKVHQWVEERALDLGGDRPVLMTMGGQASGKTSLASFAQGVGAILDAPHTDADGLVKRLAKLLGQSREVWLVWVHRNPRHALHSMLLRAVEEGRPVALSQMAGAHYHSPQAFEAVGRAFRGQSRLHLYRACNLGSPDSITVRGGRLDREGKDALDVLGELPPWGELEYLDCLLAGFQEVLEGRRGWGGTPPAADIVAFLESRLSGEDQGKVRALRQGVAYPPTPLGKPAPGRSWRLGSPLDEPVPQPGDACTMLAEALRQGIRWNHERLSEAFGQAYGLGPPPDTNLFD